MLGHPDTDVSGADREHRVGSEFDDLIGGRGVPVHAGLVAGHGLGSGGERAATAEHGDPLAVCSPATGAAVGVLGAALPARMITDGADAPAWARSLTSFGSVAHLQPSHANRTNPLPADTKLRDLVRLAKIRWRIEHDYRELKASLDLDHFEGRSWIGWHRHVTLAAVALAICPSSDAPRSPAQA